MRGVEGDAVARGALDGFGRDGEDLGDGVDLGEHLVECDEARSVDAVVVGEEDA